MDSFEESDSYDERVNVKKQEFNDDEEEDNFDDDIDGYGGNKSSAYKKQALNVVVLPDRQQTRYYRACFRCHLIKTQSQFEQRGCENCKSDLEKIMQQYNIEMKHLICKYEGTMAIMDPNQSWVAKKITKFLNGQQIVPGAYALKVVGEYGEIEDDFQGCSVDYVDNNKI